ncbi:hypothetical protein TYRP_021699 [Tyrophagus putrescentiae]|nr:hypothetical protein TYRP_021699 [Tyrophagus putrescentiae]
MASGGDQRIRCLPRHLWFGKPGRQQCHSLQPRLSSALFGHIGHHLNGANVEEHPQFVPVLSGYFWSSIRQRWLAASSKSSFFWFSASETKVTASSCICAGISTISKFILMGELWLLSRRALGLLVAG